MNGILEIFLLIAGIYYLYMVFKMKREQVIPKNLVSPKINLERSHDIPGYIDYIFVRGIVFGSLLIIFSAVIIVSLFMVIHPILVLICELGYIGALIWYTVISIKAQNKYLF